MNLLIAATQLERTVQGAPYILLMAAGAVLALFWIFFPIVVWARLNETVKLLKEIRDNTEAQASGPIKTVSAVKYRPPAPGE